MAVGAIWVTKDSFDVPIYLMRCACGKVTNPTINTEVYFIPGQIDWVRNHECRLCKAPYVPDARKLLALQVILRMNNGVALMFEQLGVWLLEGKL